MRALGSRNPLPLLWSHTLRAVPLFSWKASTLYLLQRCFPPNNCVCVVHDQRVQAGSFPSQLHLSMWYRMGRAGGSTQVYLRHRSAGQIQLR